MRHVGLLVTTVLKSYAVIYFGIRFQNCKQSCFKLKCKLSCKIEVYTTRCPKWILYRPTVLSFNSVRKNNEINQNNSLAIIKNNPCKKLHCSMCPLLLFRPTILQTFPRSIKPWVSFCHRLARWISGYVLFGGHISNSFKTLPLS